jgi:hypothetical protein
MSLLKPRIMTPARWAANRIKINRSTHRAGQAPKSPSKAENLLKTKDRPKSQTPQS